MQEGNRFQVTSTPLELSERDTSENDSGYQSNLSCINSSRNSTIILSQTRSFSRSLTPDNVSNIEPIWESCEPNLKRKDLPICRNYSNNFLNGRDFVDFFSYLGNKGCDLIIRRILSYLKDDDLYNAAAVSTLWKNVIITVPAERRRLKNYVKEIENTKENRVSNSSECEIFEDKNKESPRSSLMQIQNIRREFSLSNSPIKSSTGTPVIHSNNRFEAFQKEGLKVKIGRRLFSCPKCKLPSHVDQTMPNSAECTNSVCRYRFCILCHCEEHKTKMCDFISTPVIRKQTVSMGTMKSKKNLKRLLL